MNTAQLKTYAPEARRAFIAAVSTQAAKLGITDKGMAPAQLQGDVLLVGGQALPASYDKPRKILIERIEVHGFDQTMEAIAYTWFNRFVAIRYMELHGYLDHGCRVLSHPEGGTHPEILDHTADVDLPGLDREKAIELKLDGAKDEELYRLLLLAQCNALHEAMPFLFEKIGDETELLLPANLLHTDSLIRQLVESIDEELWGEIEIIGWLYQFYISEKKDQVIGKVVKSEDIPAATQLFTPNWIVKYMVENSLGAQWLATYPQSPLKGQMEYYIEPAEQTPEVQQQLKEITPTSLDPKTMTLIDPACGSGHILVEAYELFKAIYLELGYRQRDVPEIILQKNLFGLDIDERAAQLTGFALMMKGRADDRQLFGKEIKLNVMAFRNSAGFDADKLAQGMRLTDYRLQPGDLYDLKQLFEHATTFGSLIQMPEGLAAKLPALKQLSEATSLDLFVSEALKRLGPLAQQAELLTGQYNTVVANPPYLGRKWMSPLLKKWYQKTWSNCKSDLYAGFLHRCLEFLRPSGHSSLVTMDSWMFAPAYEEFRFETLKLASIPSLIHLGPRAFPSISGEVVSTQASVFRLLRGGQSNPLFVDCTGVNSSLKKEAHFRKGRGRFSNFKQADFLSIDGANLAYWLTSTAFRILVECPSLKKVGKPRSGLTTGDNPRFLRKWFEVVAVNYDITEEEYPPGTYDKWVPLNGGSDFRRWYGSNEDVIFWEHRGQDIKQNPAATMANPEYQFRPGATWSKISSDQLGVRQTGPGFVFSAVGLKSFPPEDSLSFVTAFLNSKVASKFIRVFAPNLTVLSGDVARLPLLVANKRQVDEGEARLVAIAHLDWNAYERSWDFQSLPILTASSEPTPTLQSSYTAWITQNRETIAEMKRLEEENNRLFIDAYGLADELTPDVPIEQITLTVNPAYRYGTKITQEDQWTRFRQDSMAELVSYAIGCMMGRYSLDEPGLVYANSGNEGFDPSKYSTFPADSDGIVPVTDTEWFDDDACNRLIDFVSVAWDKIQLEDNLTFLADNLSPKKNESSRETIRRYLCDKFFKDHLQTYKKRPIYWLFSSGKQKAFQCLVYLHRYNEGTLARMRSEYVIPLQGKMAARLEQLQGDIQAATSTSHQKRLTKEREKLARQQVELLAFDEKLRHYADMRISLDLDDGVKVNYGKFGDLLAEVKAIHGKQPEVA